MPRGASGTSDYEKWKMWFMHGLLRDYLKFSIIMVTFYGRLFCSDIKIHPSVEVVKKVGDGKEDKFYINHSYGIY